ncbi:MAG: invasion associated locus B family protein [Methylobacteriaceae bacterium]|nr:invasion associated locus B family protein [Methylobacteriaceae bacterium]
MTSLKRLLTKLLPFAAATAFFVSLATAQDASPPAEPADQAAVESATPEEQSFGMWTKRCEKYPGALVEQCRIEQYVVDEQRPNVSLLVMVFRTADGKNLFMRIVSPLGLMLPPGVRLAVNQQPLAVPVPFAQCFNVGCTAELVDNDIINSLKSAQSLHIIIWPTPDDPIGVPISLDGYAQALESL